MEELFLKLVNMSITASWMILAIIILRIVLRNAPKFVYCILWGLVAVRLVCPVSFESVLSLVPSTETITKQNISASDNATYNVSTGINAVDSRVNEYLGEGLYKDMYDSGTGTMLKNEGVDVNEESGKDVSSNIIINTDENVSMSLNTDDTVSNVRGISIMNIAVYVWIAGVAVLVIYSIAVYAGIYRKVSASIRLKGNVFICDNIDSPFILGIIKPRIYLPSTMNESEMNCVLAHENAHIARLDYLWKPLGFVILSVYWFNPVIWMAYILLCRDIELACDERVIKYMNVEDKKDYSRTLLSCSVSHRMIAACPVAFGEVAVGRRVKTVLNYKKPAFWMVSLAIVACIVVAVCFLTNPKTYADEGNKDKVTENVTEGGSAPATDNKETASKENDMLTKTTIYRYKHEYEDVQLWIMLEPETKTYRMSENFSIYDAVSVGMYEMNKDKLILTDVLSINKKYVFSIEDNALVFEAEGSAMTQYFVATSYNSIRTVPGVLTKDQIKDIYDESEYTIYEAIPNGAKYYICESKEAYEEVIKVFGEYDVKYCTEADDDKELSAFNSSEIEILYAFEYTERGTVQEIYLNTKYNTFKMKYDVYSYCAASGYFIIEDDKLILTDFNEPEKYVFKIDNGQLVFVAAESTEMPLYAHKLNEPTYQWIGRTSDETFDEAAFEIYSNNNDYEIIRFVNDGDVFRRDLFTEQESSTQLEYFRNHFEEGFTKWD